MIAFIVLPKGLALPIYERRIRAFMFAWLISVVTLYDGLCRAAVIRQNARICTLSVGNLIRYFLRLTADALVIDVPLSHLLKEFNLVVLGEP